MSNTPSVFISKQKTNDLMQNALLSGGAKKASKKASKKKTKKTSKKSQKGGASDMNLDMQVLLGRSKNHKKSGSKKSGSKKAKSKKYGSKKLGRTLPLAIVKGNEFKKFVQDEMALPGGGVLMKFSYKIWNQYKQNNPNASPDELLNGSKKLFYELKKANKLEKLLEDSKEEMKKKN